MARRVRIPVFVRRDSYRLRRWRDAARALAFLGIVLWMVPLTWLRGETSNAAALVFIFVVWIGLILAAAVIAPRTLQAGRDDSGADD